MLAKLATQVSCPFIHVAISLVTFHVRRNIAGDHLCPSQYPWLEFIRVALALVYLPYHHKIAGDRSFLPRYHW